MVNIHELEAQVQELMQRAFVPGLSLAIIQDGALTYARGFGTTSVESNGGTVTPETIFRIGSVTKMLTGTMIMHLVEKEVLDLDKPVHAYIDWLRFSEPDVEHQITLKMLLSHTSGLVSGLNYQGARYAGGLATYVREDIPNVPMAAPPGTGYYYSNHGINLAAHIAEVVTGKSYPQLMQEILFKPQNMTRSTFDPLQALTYPLAQSHRLTDDEKLYVNRPFVDNPAQYPCGFGMSTAYDLANFVSLHLGTTFGRPVIKPETAALMHDAHADRYMTRGDAYGLTFRTYPHRGVRFVGHNGAIHKYGGWLWFAPDEGVGAVMLVNRAPNFWGYAAHIMTTIFNQLLDLRDTPLTPVMQLDRSKWSQYAGDYLGNSVGLVSIRESDNRLEAVINGVKVNLQAVREDVYTGERPGGGTVSIGFVDAETLMLGGTMCRRFDYVPVSDTPSAKLAGVYTGELDVFTARTDDERLFIYSEDDRIEVPCIALNERHFASDMGLFEFMDNGELLWSKAFTFSREDTATA